MKKLILIALATSGILLCHTKQSSQMDEQTDQPKLSGFEREALETQSPRVHPQSKNKTNKHRTDRITADKQTINAYIPVGK